MKKSSYILILTLTVITVVGGGTYFGLWGDTDGQTNGAKQLESDKAENVTDMAKRAQAFIDISDFKGALELSSKAVAIDDKNADAWAALSSANYWMGDHKDAVEAADKALALDDKNIQALKMKAMAQLAQGSRTDALDTINKATEINSKDAGLWAEKKIGRAHV